MTYLHSILVFALLRYKQSLLEARGFERTSLSSSDLRRDDETLPEVLYSRYVTLTGYVRQAWPKSTNPRIGAIQVKLLAAPVNPPPTALEVVDILAAMEYPASAGNPYVVYYGSALQPAVVNENFVLQLTSYLTKTRQKTLGYTPKLNEYEWFVIPDSLASGMDGSDFIDASTAEPAGWSLVGTATVAGVLCQVWRSDRNNLGNLTLIIT